MEGAGGPPGRKTETPSLEEVSEYRAKAQQGSMDAIRGAEERYFGKLGEIGRSAAGKAGDAAARAKDAGAETGKSAAAYAEELTAAVKEKTATAAKAAVEKSAAAKDKVAESLVGSREEDEEKGAKVEEGERALEKESMDLAKLGGGILEAIGETVLEIAQSAKDLLSLGMMTKGKKKHSEGGN